ncbi:6-phosphogluconolactonase [Chlamydia trachomatis]|uniref:6-phosphogluconolactonase n=1 Tax=Chlamydia trachomatis TaxID=813 RepID=UPI0009FB36C1|nr:6-phosphogluconolactonase [Chlamydia trachomatis]
MATLISLNDANRMLIADSQEEFLQIACYDWISTANKAIHKRGAFYVALSGGKTPLQIFQEIVKKRAAISDCSKIVVFWGDERANEDVEAGSNYLKAMDILKGLCIPEDQIFRMDTADPKGDEAYEALIQKYVPDAIFDMVMLGVGEDGHTLSLFPETHALEEKERFVVFNEVPQLHTRRMTLTFPIVRQARHLVAYVQGENKQDLFHKLVHPLGRDTFPIERVGTPLNPVQWVLSSDSCRKTDLADIPADCKLEMF